MRRTITMRREVEATAHALTEVVRDLTAWPSWWSGIVSVERLEAADAIQLVRVRSALYRSGRPFTLEVVEQPGELRMREVGHSHEWGLCGAWRWETVDRRVQSVELELGIRNEFYQLLSRRRLRNAAASWLEHLGRRAAGGAEPVLPSVQIFEAGRELWMQYQGRTYRLVERGSEERP